MARTSEHPSKPGTASAAGASEALPEWNLDDLYDGVESEALANDLTGVSADAKAFAERYRGKLGDIAAGDGAGAKLAGAIEAYEGLSDRLGRIAAFATLTYTGDTTDPARIKFYGDIQDKLTTISTDLLFFSLELNRISDQRIEAALEDPELAHYRPWLEDLRKERPYQLSDDIERLFHEKSVSSSSAWNRLFSETIANMRFDIGGESVAIEPALNGLLEHDRDRRREAGKALASTFAEHVGTFTLITNTLAKDKSISDNWRGFGDIADSRHLANRVEREVVDALVSAVEANYANLSHRYYAIKARWLGLDKLEFWDRNAPLPEAPAETVPWAQARKTVLDAYAGFSPTMSEIAQRFFDNNWIDAPVRPGKAPGAFSHPTVPSAHPYVLLNYQGKVRDVMTLAHELGHGVHQVLAAPQGALMAQTPLTLAETASVFGEMLTFRALLARTGDDRTRKALLASKVEDMLNTVVRQIAFYSFEREVHSARKEGELTAKRLGEIWLDVQRRSLGPAVNLAEGYETFWCYIPHFIHSPFYVYAYAFGDCMVNSLYALYEDAEQGFAEKYLDMLRAGGSKHHSELLAPFGLDAAEPDFWNRGLGVITTMIDELEALEA